MKKPKLSDRKIKKLLEVKNRDGIFTKELDRAAEVAWYFGFNEIKTPRITKEDVSLARQFKGNLEGTEGGILLNPEEKVAILRLYDEHNMQSLSQPVMLCFKKPLPSELGKKTSRGNEFGLEILGTSRPIAETVAIKTTLSILEENGFSEMTVEVNSVGDRESASRFERELSSYYRKHINSMPATCRQASKNDVFEIVKTEDEKCFEIRDQAPQSMSYLSEASREHFKEILESLEELKVPYRINNSLVGTKEYFPQTMFVIKEGALSNDGSGKILAVGERFNSVGRRIGLKKEVYSVGVSIVARKIELKKFVPKKIPKPKFYFIQLGPEAKLKSLFVIDVLRKARIPVCHSLTKDKIVGQIGAAENMHLPYILIMGQKEAHENSVLVRNTTTRAQDTVAITDLPQFLKKLK